MAGLQPDFQVLGSALVQVRQQIPIIINSLQSQIAGLEKRSRASDKNQIARLRNSFCRRPDCDIAPLVHVMTGDEIPNFPATIGHVQTLDSPEADRILAALEQPVDGPVEERRSRILRAVGVVVLAVMPESE